MKKNIFTLLLMLGIIATLSGISVYASNEDKDALNYIEQGKQSYKEHNYKESIEYYSKAAKLGNSDAMVLLGSMYENGEGIETDCPKAFEYYKKAAELNNPKAFGKMGECYLYGKGVDINFDIGFGYLEKGEELNDPNSIGTIGYVYQGGYNKERNYDIAIEKLVQASEAEEAWAMNILASIYTDGEYVNKNEELAEQYYQKALPLYKEMADSGNRIAMNRVGLMLHNGQGTEINLEEAAKYYKLSAECGLAVAYENMAAVYIDMKENDLAVSELQKGVDKGSASCANYLGSVFKEGNIVKKDLELSDQYYKIAFNLYKETYENNRLSDASRGNAANMLAVYYYDGLGVEKNEQEAFSYAQKSAALNYGKGIYNLGYFHKISGDYNGMIECYTRAFDLVSKSDRENIKKVFMSLVDSGEIDFSSINHLVSEREYDEYKKMTEEPQRQKNPVEMFFDIIGIIIYIIVGIIGLLMSIGIIYYICRVLVQLRGIIQLLIIIASLVISCNLLKIIVFNLWENNMFYGAILYYNKSVPIIQTVLGNAVAFDVALSVTSFIDLLMSLITRKRFLSARLPVVLAIIVMLAQIIVREKKFYCEKCSRNIGYRDLICRCNSCMNTQPVKFVNVFGLVNCKCSNKECIHKDLRTTFSRFNPYGKGNNQRRSLICRNCSSVLISEDVINITAFSVNPDSVIAFYVDFFYHAFGKARKDKSLHIDSVNPSSISSLYSHYEKWDSHSTPKDSSYSFYIKADILKKATYYLRIACANTEKYPLISSEGMVVLINGSEDSATRQKTVDSFLLELDNIKTSGQQWNKPVLLGICANNVPYLEELISDGFKDQKDMESKAKTFLQDNGNEDIIYSMSANIMNVHFFIFRTGSKHLGTEDEVYNVVPPIQSLMYAEHKDILNVWNKDTNGLFIN